MEILKREFVVSEVIICRNQGWWEDEKEEELREAGKGVDNELKINPLV